MLFNPIFHEAIYIVGRFSRDFMVMNFQVEHDGTTSSLSYFMVYIYIIYVVPYMVYNPIVNS
jgi:hypothetical protein